MSGDAAGARWVRLFLPFAAGYFLSYLYRTANAVIGPVLARELSLPDNALGLLTSTYFLAFGAAQLPLGVLLDRYGPRRVEALLLLVAAAGTTAFALAQGLAGLAFGRGLIGLGVSACLMASLKAFSQWFPADRQASMTGWIMASGGLGALAAAKPLELALEITGWREICFGLAGATAAVAVAIGLLTPEKPTAARHVQLAAQFADLAEILKSRQFWRYAPMGFWVTGGFMAVQGLWASRWMNVMEGLGPTAVANRLSWIGLAMLAGFLFMGFFATPLVRRGVSLSKLYTAAMALGVACLAAVAGQPGWGDFLWPLLGIGFSLSTIAYSLVAQAFPLAWSGRANTAFNLTLFAGAFLLQWGIGIVVDALQAAGWTPAEAYRAAFAALLAGQVGALVWLVAAGNPDRAPAPPA